MKEFEINLSEIGNYVGEEYEIWDEKKCEWIDVKNSCYLETSGFPDPYLAQEPITAIGVRYTTGGTFVFGCGEYHNDNPNVTYIQCKDEWTLCKNFLNHWQENYPDVVSGWNTKFFDIPYLYNRFLKILGEPDTKKLSPWGLINQRKVQVMNKENIAYELVGIGAWDYIELYRGYAPEGKSQENYRLDTVANAELGEGKLSYDEYDNLHTLYRLDYQKFIDYNIKDVDLIFKLDDKLKLFSLGYALSYGTKCNYDDIFAQTRMWDSLIYNKLLESDIIVPPKTSNTKDGMYEGAYVKEVQVGLHKYLASFDLNSLHPHLMMQYNMSPEMLIEPWEYTDEMRRIISDGVSVEKLLYKKIDLSGLKGVTLTPNGQFFRTDKPGFLTLMLEELYNDRKKYKNLMLKAEQEYENETDPVKKNELAKKVSMLNNLQLAKKLTLNSCYGAFGSQYFRMYDLRIAEAVTLASQLSIKWIANAINGYLNGVLKMDRDYIVASDTDSVYVRLDELVQKVYGEKLNIIPVEEIIKFMDKVCTEKFEPFIDKTFQELSDYVHAYQQKMKMKREVLADKGLWTAKKRYVLNVYNSEGVQYAEPHLKIKGLEMVKSSTPTAVRTKMYELLRIIINGSEADVQKFIANFREEFKKMPPEEISSPRGMNGLKEYSDPVTLYKKGAPIHVRGAILYNHYLKQLKLEKKYPAIQQGEKLKFTYLKQPNPLKDNVISFSGRLPVEFKLNDYIDYDTQFEKTFVDPMSTIINCIGWKAVQVNSLDAFF